MTNLFAKRPMRAGKGHFIDPSLLYALKLAGNPSPKRTSDGAHSRIYAKPTAKPKT